MKKKILIIMLMVFILSLSISFADTKADELNKLKILQGDGSDYLLDQQVTRAQALAFVIRLIGKENLVKEKKNILDKPRFSDVQKGKWYTPYTSYGKFFGLVKGYGDNTFKPEAYLSEREFYSMVLNALDIEHKWENVEEVAYGNKIILNKDDSNTQKYLRSSVVDVLYKTLENNKNLIDNLVKSGVITEDVANDLMINKTDEVKTKIEKVTSTDTKNVNIILNEKIKSAEVSISDNISVENIKFDDKKISITTDTLISGEEYKLTLNKVVDSQGFETDSLTKNFVVYEKKEVKSNYFLISKIEPQSKNLIHVYFTHPITISAEIQFKYKLYSEGDLLVEGDFDNLEVSKLGKADNVIGIWFNEETLIDGKEYELKIDGDLTSQYSARLDSGDGDSMTFYANGSENEDLAIKSFKPYDNGIIRIQFNKDLDSNSATKTSNYKIDGNFGEITPTNIEFTGQGDNKYRQIDIKVPSGHITGSDEKIITFEDIEDTYNAAKINKEEIEFKDPIEAQVDSVQIESVVAVNKGLVNIYFDRAIDNYTNSKADSILISNASAIDDTYIFDRKKPYVFQIFMKDGDYLTDNDHEITIFKDTFEDSLGIKNEKTKITFDGSSQDIPKLRFSEAIFVEKNKVLVRFNYPVKTSSATIASNFKLSYKEDDDTEYINAKSVGKIDSKRYVISFSDVSSSEEYKIEADNIIEYSGEYTTDDISKSVER